MRKNIITIIIVIIVVTFIQSCSQNNDVYNQEIFQFNNVYNIPRVVFEDKDYIYLSSGENSDIKRMNKQTEETENLNISGSALTVYKNYLYYIGELRKLYRINLEKLNEAPEFISDYVDYHSYYIVNDLIYFYPTYSSLFSININDFSQTTEYEGQYFIAGIDEKYRYITTKKFENNNDVYTLARCLYKDGKFENREYLSEIIHPDWAEYRFNDFLAIKDDFAYYKISYDFHDILYKCELNAGAENKIIYESNEYERFDIIAVTDDGIYINKFQIGGLSIIYNEYICKLDLNGENETILDYSPDLTYFVSSEDGKLKYIQDNKIHLVE